MQIFLSFIFFLDSESQQKLEEQAKLEEEKSITVDENNTETAESLLPVEDEKDQEADDADLAVKPKKTVSYLVNDL